MNKAHNIYIHVPFCISKCNYCAFFSHACASPDWDKYTDGILSEIEHWGKILGKISVPTIFFGGGTPSLAPVKHIEQIINKINSCFDLNNSAEISLESNPGTIDAIKMQDLKSVGINRLSVGVQSLDDNKLQYLGRKHSANDALQTLAHAKEIGLRTSGDFIYGLPGETVNDVIDTCKKINSIGLTHCSMYELTIEPDTPLGRQNPTIPDNETMANMYMAIADTLNLKRYEVSNYCTPGNECQHNMNVWDGMPYIGIGRGAAGRILIDNTWYEQRGNGAEFKPISETERAIEKVITGMRTTRGVNLTDDIKQVININSINSMPDLIKITDNRMHVTEHGMLILDDILVKIIR